MPTIIMDCTKEPPQSAPKDNPPAALPPNESRALDTAITQQRQWVLWRYDRRDDDWSKVPYSASTGRMASSTDSATWSTYGETLDRYEAGGFAGIGFVFRKGGGVVGVDLDDCRNPETGAVEDWAQEIIDRLGSYAEVSPSETGIKILLFGELPPGRRRKDLSSQFGPGRQIEMYDQGRYFTITGHKIASAPDALTSGGDELLKLHSEIFGAAAESPKPVPPPEVGIQAPSPDDADIIEKVGSKTEFEDLWLGTVSSRYGSQSEADLALASRIAFFVGRDPAAVERIFSQSVLGKRGKWTERSDYRNRTVNKAIDGCRNFYDWGNGQPPQHEGNELDFLRRKLKLPNLSKIRKYGKTGGMYELELSDGQRIQIGNVTKLRSVKAVSDAVFDATQGASSIKMDCRGWPQVAQVIARNAEVIEVESDLDQLRTVLEEFEQRRTYAATAYFAERYKVGSTEWWDHHAEKISTGHSSWAEGCFRDADNRLVLRKEALRHALIENKHPYDLVNNLARLLRQLDFDTKKLFFKREKDGKPASVRVWRSQKGWAAYTGC